MLERLFQPTQVAQWTCKSGCFKEVTRHIQVPTDFSQTVQAIHREQRIIELNLQVPSHFGEIVETN